MIRRNITYKDNSLIAPLYKAIVRPHLDDTIYALYCQRYKFNLSGAFTTLCDLLMSGSTRDCDRSTVGLDITFPDVVRVVSSELPGGGGGICTKRGSTSLCKLRWKLMLFTT